MTASREEQKKIEHDLFDNSKSLPRQCDLEVIGIIFENTNDQDESKAKTLLKKALTCNRVGKTEEAGMLLKGALKLYPDTKDKGLSILQFALDLEENNNKSTYAYKKTPLPAESINNLKKYKSFGVIKDNIYNITELYKKVYESYKDEEDASVYERAAVIAASRIYQSKDHKNDDYLETISNYLLDTKNENNKGILPILESRELKRAITIFLTKNNDPGELKTIIEDKESLLMKWLNPRFSFSNDNYKTLKNAAEGIKSDVMPQIENPSRSFFSRFRSNKNSQQLSSNNAATAVNSTSTLSRPSSSMVGLPRGEFLSKITEIEKKFIGEKGKDYYTFVENKSDLADPHYEITIDNKEKFSIHVNKMTTASEEVSTFVAMLKAYAATNLDPSKLPEITTHSAAAKQNWVKAFQQVYPAITDKSSFKIDVPDVASPSVQSNQNQTIPSVDNTNHEAKNEKNQDDDPDDTQTPPVGRSPS